MQPIRRAAQLATRDYDFQQLFVLLQAQQAAPELALHYTLKVRYIIRGHGSDFIHD
jgi:hypothetical protein